MFKELITKKEFWVKIVYGPKRKAGVCTLQIMWETNVMEALKARLVSEYNLDNLEKIIF